MNVIGNEGEHYDAQLILQTSRTLYWRTVRCAHAMETGEWIAYVIIIVLCFILLWLLLRWLVPRISAKFTYQPLPGDRKPDV